MASVFVADTHIDIHDHCRIGQFIRFLEFLEQQNITIYILGDLFNFWAGQAQSRLSAVQPLLQAMARLSNRLYFLGGNRDFLFARYWKKRGYQVIADRNDCGAKWAKSDCYSTAISYVLKTSIINV